MLHFKLISMGEIQLTNKQTSTQWIPPLSTRFKVEEKSLLVFLHQEYRHRAENMEGDSISVRKGRTKNETITPSRILEFSSVC